MAKPKDAATMAIRRTLLALLAIAACSPSPEPAQAEAAPEGSLFAAAPAQQWRLPDRLREISGLAAAPDGRLFGHDDETAVIYEIDAGEGRLIKAFALGDPPLTGDFEGLAITPAGDFWLTTSEGRLHRFREGEDGAAVAYEQFDAGLADICEIEGLAYLAAEESLILACKRNEARDMRDTISLHAWPIGGGDAALWRTLPAADAASAAGVRRFRPSSLDVDTRSGRLILLSANDGALAEIGADGALVSARALAGDHRQAEGAAVLRDGALAIADEAGGRSHEPMLRIYPRAGQ